MYNEAYGPDIGVALIILSIHEAYGHDIGVALIIHYPFMKPTDMTSA